MSADCPECVDLIPGAGRLCTEHTARARQDAADETRDEAS